MTYEELMNRVENGELVKHHTARHRGYVSRKGHGVIRTYSGIYGKGYTLESPAWDSTTYDWITYYVEKGVTK